MNQLMDLKRIIVEMSTKQKEKGGQFCPGGERDS